MNSQCRVFYGMAMAAALIFLWGCAGSQGLTAAPAQDRPPGATVVAPGGDAGGTSHAALGDILFQRRAGKEDVSLVFSRIPEDINLTQPSDTTIALTMKETVRAESAREYYTPQELRQVRSLSVLPLVLENQPGLVVEMELAEMVPYRMNRSGTSVVLSFDTATLAAPAPRSGTESPDYQEALRAHLEQEALRITEQEPGEYRGERLSIICQDTDIKNVFRLISEVSGYNIVAGPDVTEKVTLHMRNVPWDQALDTVLEVNNLGMTTRGRVITVMPLERMKEAEEERLKKEIAEGKRDQIAIEAMIVEASTNFARELGVRWGAAATGTWGRRDMGAIFGSSAPSADTEAAFLSGGGLTSDMLAVNFPSAAFASTPALGVFAASSKFLLEAKLHALEASGDGKIISSPKVTTMDNNEASISQGEELYILIRDETGTTSQRVDAALSLKVTPKITSEGKISMRIKATNKYVDWARAGTPGLAAPPLIASEVNSDVLVNNGDTIVIGGIYKSSDSTDEAGIPGLNKIPFLRWLFRYESVDRTQTELLIFITPVILARDSIRSY